jgi:hypothetical protein
LDEGRLDLQHLESRQAELEARCRRVHLQHEATLKENQTLVAKLNSTV